MLLKLKCLSIVIPSNSTWSESLTLTGPIVTQSFGYMDFPRSISWNFCGFVLSEFKLNHLGKIFISCSRLFKITERLSPQETYALSSAQLHISDFSINRKISLTKILKSRGPRKYLWWILLVTLAQALYEDPILLICLIVN